MSQPAWKSFGPAPTPKPFRLALIQMLGSKDKAYNLKHARELIFKATAGDGKKSDLVVLPECFNSPYGVTHFPEFAESINFDPEKKYDIITSPSETVQALSTAAKEAGIWLIGGSMPERDGNKLYNTATVYNPSGELVTIHRKVHLFDIDIPGKITFKESESLTGGSKLTYFDANFGRIGLGICYDIRFPEQAIIAAHQGCIAMIYPSAFNMTTGPLHWELLQRARAVDNQMYVSMCSPARDMSADYHAWGHSTIIDPYGIVVATIDENEGVVYGDIDPQKIADMRAGIPVRSQKRYDIYPNLVESAVTGK
ncbi:carbon-nitrogen hydrolase [Dacryopinax primogenitus]|uniref:Carbon-nitrogen hydrolase n=1 Tax=Dacryopinax primogenitus (strain DJM 731) TaxID=1858805 RepID=M5GGJ9_DACPD|nr:carbon-nitrogen hydrolase [Dacryopinax primogenitus]EJU05618.1 carbon-nitrogen hydrolase [Dacryopinax primogenitus]